MHSDTASHGKPTRRDFVKSSTAAAVAAATASSLVIPRSVHAAESNTLKVGLIGCGGRGGGAAVNALHADANAKIVALGDMFKDRLETKLGELKNSEVGDRVQVADEHKYSGWDAYKGVIDVCDVVLLATPPHFRPMHVKAVIEAGKHCFCEKPVAVDAPGVRSVMETAALAKTKNVSLVSGLCYRYDDVKREVIDDVHNGVAGEIRLLQHNYLTGGLWMNPRQKEWSDMEWQLRNWLYFYWLSGDHIVEQHIHSIDKMMWVMKDEPFEKVIATGGRVQRTSPEYGNIYDHFNTCFEWENGVRGLTCCRQFVQCATDVSDYVYTEKGVVDIMNHKITMGKTLKKRKPSKVNMYDAEHVALFKSIRDAKPINNGDYMCKSTLAAIAARMSAYSGKSITWDEALNSKESYTPAQYAFGPLPVGPIVIPGVAPTAATAAKTHE
jgi:myo-inositol 2-dehydrogenase/D-chiro-inositol 1-dehydrogenase